MAEITEPVRDDPPRSVGDDDQTHEDSVDNPRVDRPRIADSPSRDGAYFGAGDCGGLGGHVL